MCTFIIIVEWNVYSMFCSHFLRSFVRSFVHCVPIPPQISQVSLGRGASAAEDPVERKLAQIVLQCMMINKEAAVAAARQDLDHIHDTSLKARGRWFGATADAAPFLPSTAPTSGGDDAANGATTAWSQQLESMDLD
jgi:hypothetical protein